MVSPRSSSIYAQTKKEDDLPPAYTCTLFKMDYIHVKKELDNSTTQSKDRSWRKLYVELQGTLLSMYHRQGDATPLTQHSMQNADSGLAPEYSKYPHVLRLRLQTGEQFLLRARSCIEMVSWIEHFQASNNISIDLDRRKMPRFLTLPRSTHHSGLATVSVNVGNKTVVSVCRTSMYQQPDRRPSFRTLRDRNLP
ncbi:uncharacterized protein BYT42DRAFT_561670 [Radiomyces spectabilis]|uniref:uncharacterized protein n=1 Tax=Radiomyces spectabilis TaxID=64574 RepID=UPI002220F93C|nr:uncharacterized protein BYT42DRAFT_561670 [Radiomyces spectabilis]KAI8388910.1 hypothetical protein BYT42DRAFT_561670 [Radiomyces spectabilis]